ncbi:hypothetical protein [Halohasta litorea]|uniref:Uncharacterized protein n=1 Tax=Halohasta litorea TaxID=869891 RepID=A0ABD6D2S3_9EURY|nr:hypothetical protein [Halohasta litorea]
MSLGLKIINGISKWIRDSVGSEAENRGENDADESDGNDTDGDETDDGSDDRDSPVCCSAASNTDLTVLDEQ